MLSRINLSGSRNYVISKLQVTKYIPHCKRYCTNMLETKYRRVYSYLNLM